MLHVKRVYKKSYGCCICVYICVYMYTCMCKFICVSDIINVYPSSSKAAVLSNISVLSVKHMCVMCQMCITYIVS